MSKSVLLVLIRYERYEEFEITSQQIVFESPEAARVAAERLDAAYSRVPYIYITTTVLTGVA